MTPCPFVPRPDHFLRPMEVLRHAELAAINARKTLSALRPRSPGESGAVVDAIRRADFVEHFARYGQTLDAASASELAGRLEIIIDSLADRMLALSQHN